MTFSMIHENYNVRDLDASIAFYQKALGLHEVRRKTAPDGAYIIAFLADDTNTFELAAQRTAVCLLCPMRRFTFRRRKRNPLPVKPGSGFFCLDSKAFAMLRIPLGKRQSITSCRRDDRLHRPDRG